MHAWPSPRERHFQFCVALRNARFQIMLTPRRTSKCFFTLSTRRTFAARLAALFRASALRQWGLQRRHRPRQNTGAVQKLDGDGKPAGKGFITPLIIPPTG